jgi:hypothetical protein
VLGATGWGKWFPWSIVPLFAGVAGPRVEALALGSFAVLALAFAAGVGATTMELDPSRRERDGTPRRVLDSLRLPPRRP